MKAPMGTYKIRRKLPVAHSTEIGRIITRFAYAEHLIRSIAYRLLRLSPKQGRIAVQDYRAENSITLLQDLVDLAGITVTADWKTLKNTMKECEAFRNRLAHSIWVKHTETDIPVLQSFTASYTSVGNLSRKPKIDPISLVIPIDDLRNITQNVDKAIDYLIRLDRLVIRLMQQSPPETPALHNEQATNSNAP